MRSDHLGVSGGGRVVGFLGNELVAKYRIRTGRRIGSAALVADGLHARTDGFTSLAVVLCAAGAWLGFPIADPIIGLLITVAILFVLNDAAHEVYRRLMDAVDPAPGRPGRGGYPLHARAWSTSPTSGCAGTATSCWPRPASPWTPPCH